MLRIQHLLLVSVAACFPQSDDPPRPNGPPDVRPDAPPLECPDRPGCPRPPPPPEDPLRVELGEPQRLAAGTTHVIAPSSSPTFIGVELTSSDPSILTAEVVDTNHLRLISHAPGVVTLEGRRTGFPQILDTLEVTSVPVETIEVTFRAVPGANAPITALAGLANTNDTICIRYLGAGGEFLPGRGQFASSGPVLQILPSASAGRVSEWFAQRSTCVGLGFGALGAADLIASVEAGISRSIPVEVIAAPATAQLLFMVLGTGSTLLPAPDPVHVNQLVGVNLVGQTADGRFVGGLGAIWTMTPPASSFITETTELVFVMSGAGTATITATAGSVIRSQAITAN